MKNILNYVNMLIVILLLTSCEEYLDVNVDPNNPTSATPDLILPVAQKYSAELIHASYPDPDLANPGARANTIGNLMMYNWSQSDGFAWYPDEFKYNVTSSFYATIFSNSYTTALKQYHLLTELGESYENYKAIGMIMKAYHFQLLVDFYGDVPYSEALLRKDNATPKYDKAQDIYTDLIKQLTDANALINSAKNPIIPGADDVMFRGNMTTWKKFANTVKLRIAVRSKNATAIAAAFADPAGFITADVMVQPGYSKNTGKQNPFWNLYGQGEDGTKTMTNNATCATDYVLSYLTTTQDPRLDFLYEKPATGHKGVKQGLLDYDTPVVDAFVPEKVSNIGPGLLKSPSMGACIFTKAENDFNKAEAALAQPSLGSAQTFYEDGVKASFLYLGAGSATAYLAKDFKNVSWASSPNKLEAIITQKWIAVNGITAEQSWFDYTRTKFPANLPISLQASTSDRPVRLFYPSSELSANGANVPAQPNAFTGKIFWAN